MRGVFGGTAPVPPSSYMCLSTLTLLVARYEGHLVCKNAVLTKVNNNVFLLFLVFVSFYYSF